ncbi:MAG: AEC family transporter [Pseudomonadota bacterium]|nr:AEC family transporter [Pseudomonadota bacterium]
MSAFVLLIACLLLGVLVARFARPPMGLAQGLNWWVINIALPAMVLDLVPRVQIEWQSWYLPVSQWLVFAGSFVLFRALGRHFGWSRARIGGLIIMGGLGNTSFLGYPLLEALRGREGLAVGVVADQLGCFLMLAVSGTIVSAMYSGGHTRPREIALKVLKFPPFAALLLGALVGMSGGWPPIAEDILLRVGSTLVPLALFSVGLRFRFHLGNGQALPVALSLGWKLLVAPLLIVSVGWLCGVGGLTLTIATLQASMAPMISAAILCDQHHLDSPLANSILGGGILLSLLTVPLWNLALP